MFGMSQDEEKQMLRQAQIAKYINQLYEDAFQDWCKKRPDKLIPVARHACALYHYRRERLPAGATTLDAFADFRDWYSGSRRRSARLPDALRRSRSSASSSRAPKRHGSPQARVLLLHADEYPTHRMLQELMKLEAIGAEREQIARVATLLLPWCRDGNYGASSTDESNISLTGKIAHFELGYIPESAKELKSAAGFLITNYTRQHIMTMPRAMRKRNVYEEVARFLDIPKARKSCRESYAQMRKFNSWNISIVQQYSRFKESRIRSAVFGNSRQFFIMKQNDRADLDDIAQDIALPEVTKQTIMNYPLPDQQSGQKYSAFTYFHIDVSGLSAAPSTTSLRAEMLYCSSTSGEHFEKRARELKGHTDILEGIAAHANGGVLTEEVARL